MAHDLLNDMGDLESAEDFLDYFDVRFDAEVVEVSRLHILQRFHDYLSRLPEATRPTYREFKECLTRAYDDFVCSDVLTERVFRVHKRAVGIATVPLSAIGKARRQ